MANKNIRALSYRKGLDDNLFENISAVAKNNASDSEFKDLSKKYMVDDSVIVGTSSFYDFTRKENRNKKIHICSGTACMVSKKQNELIDFAKSQFSDEEIGHAACVGRCHTNHAFMMDNKTYSASTEESFNDIIEKKELQENKYNVACNTTPILTGPVVDLKSFYALAENYKDLGEIAINMLKTSKLRGRGGAGFPFWFKLDTVIKETADQKFIVCNADEGDPGAYSDMYLMEEQPHKVLFGMYMSGIIVGANVGVLYVRGEYPDSIRILKDAIDLIEKEKYIKNFKFKIIEGQGSYVCGEETALLNSIEGLRPEVRVRPPYPAQYGLYGKPTVLSNVETFANVHWILENSGATYAKLGTEQSTGTKLVSLDGRFNAPGMYEIEMGTDLKTVFEEYGKGFVEPVKGFQIGGPLGGIVPLSKVNDLTLDFESFSSNNFLLGHASVVSIPESFPMIKFLEHLMEFTALESCGKCYPCRIGSQRGFEMLQKAQETHFLIDRNLFNDLLETLEIGSLCALGGGVPLPMKNALHYFEDELKSFFN